MTVRANHTAARPRAAAWLPLRVARVLLLVYCGWCALLYFEQSALVYSPSSAGAGMSEERIARERDVQRLWVKHQDGVSTEAWLTRAHSLPAKGLVCFLHGNAELIDDALFEARAWNARGMDVVLPEYRGYARSGGTPSQEAIVTDVLDVLYAAQSLTQQRRVTLHGRSLGSGVAAQVALRLHGNLDALILESAFTSIASYAWRYGIPQFLVTDPYRTDAAFAQLDCAMLLLHARADDIVPVQHSRTLATLNPRTQLVELEGSHNSGLALTPAYWDAIDAFMQRAPHPQLDSNSAGGQSALDKSALDKSALDRVHWECIGQASQDLDALNRQALACLSTIGVCPRLVSTICLPRGAISATISFAILFRETSCYTQGAFWLVYRRQAASRYWSRLRCEM